MPTIQIITFPGQKLSSSAMVSGMSHRWRQLGFDVSVGPSRTVTGDVAILHYDLSRVLASILPANPLGRPLLNQHVDDITKRRISGGLLRIDSDWSGPVIVKTDLNSTGGPERTLGNVLQKNVRRIADLVRTGRPLKNYLYFEKLCDVPAWVWRRADLVVEKFTPEIEAGQFTSRVWFFFGDAQHYIKRFSTDPFVKLGNSTRVDILDEPIPPALEEARRALRFDFGKFDFVLHNGKVVLLDVNKTPSMGDVADQDGQRRMAEAIRQYL